MWYVDINLPKLYSFTHKSNIIRDLLIKTGRTNSSRVPTKFVKETQSVFLGFDEYIGSYIMDMTSSCTLEEFVKNYCNYRNLAPYMEGIDMQYLTLEDYIFIYFEYFLPNVTGVKINSAEILSIK